MCGIAGEIRTDGQRADTAAVEAMADAMKARGPDGDGTWHRWNVALAHRRLSIIDLSERGAQPMVDDTLGLSIVFNGCIYDHKQIRAELERDGYHFRSTSDTEVLLKAWHRWGEDCLHRLHGMFAFAVVEHRSGRTVLVRDRLGIKPLYTAEVAGALRFASTLPALLRAGGVDTSIDPVALHHYLSFHSVVPAPHTILNGVRKVPPATMVVVEPDGHRHERRWWEPSFDRAAERAEWSERDWEDAVLESLRVAVDRRLVADVPVGVLLSGGLDSSLVVGLLAEAGQKDLATFSIGFESHGGIEGDEFRYSDIVAEHFGTDHHQIRIPSHDLVPALDGAIEAMSEPMVSHDVVAFSLLSEQVARHVKVVQSGQGADEVFAGYHWYPPMLDRGDDPDAAVDGYADVFFDADHDAVNALLQAEHRVEQDVSRGFVAQHLARTGATRAIDRVLRLDTEVMLVDDPVKRVDNMTMAWSLEARVPFLDHDLVELAATCPPELKLAHDGKGVLKQAARQVIPHEVIDRPKGYFPVPALSHLEGEALDLVADSLRDPQAKARGLFDPDHVEDLLADPNGSITPLRGNRLWQLGLLERWLQVQGVGA